MKPVYIIIFLFVNFFSFNIFSQTIAVVNIQSLIDNNKIYQKTLKDIEINQEKFVNDFNKMENELTINLNEIEESKLILSKEEINIKIENYNNQLSQFNFLIEKFNFHYENEIIQIRETIFKEIIKLLEKYALKKSIDLILDSTTYLIASNSLDITIDINSELEKLNLKLEYKDFEKN